VGSIRSDYMDFQPDRVTVYLRDVRGVQIFEACRPVRDDYDLSDSHSRPVDLQAWQERSCNLSGSLRKGQ
jgi:hypothetical protein